MMPNKLNKLSFWSAAICDVILGSISESQLRGLSASSGSNEERNSASEVDLRAQIVRRSRRSRRLQRELMQIWRREHADIVSAADIASLDGPGNQCEAMLRQFGAEDVLLEMITDEHEDGWELAHTVVQQVACAETQNELMRILENWSVETSKAAAATAAKGVRVVVFGGRVRDESKHFDLFEDSPFDVRWMVCERNHGSADYRILNNAMKYSDALIVVAGMVSHTIMWRVKRYAKIHEVPWKPIPKATDRHLKDALVELFPNQASADLKH